MALSIEMLEDTVQRAAEILGWYWRNNDLVAKGMALLEVVASKSVDDKQAQEEIVQAMKSPVIEKLKSVVRSVEGKSGENYVPCPCHGTDPLQRLKEETDDYCKYIFDYYMKEGGFFRNAMWKELNGHYDKKWHRELRDAVMDGCFLLEKVLRAFDPTYGTQFTSYAWDQIHYRLLNELKEILKRDAHVKPMGAIEKPEKETEGNSRESEIPNDDAADKSCESNISKEKAVDKHIDTIWDDDFIPLARAVLKSKESDRGTHRLGYFQQSVLFYYHFQGMPSKQVAEKLGSSENTVDNQLVNARGRLHNFLNEQRNQDDEAEIVGAIRYLLNQDENAMMMLASRLKSQSLNEKLAMLEQLYARIAGPQ